MNLQCRSNKTEMVTLSATTWRVASGMKLVPSADPQTTNISIFIDCSTCLQSKESMDGKLIHTHYHHDNQLREMLSSYHFINIIFYHIP